MIERMLVHKIATYKNAVEILPRKLNFIYGSNGSGKTTISNLLGNYVSSDDSLLEMKTSKVFNMLVYNKKFVEENFSQSTNSVKGIFTLGEATIHNQEELERLHIENESKKESLTTKEQSIKDIDNQIILETSKVSEKSWKIQQNIGNDFSEALKGFRSSKKNFFEQCINVYNNWSENDIESLEELKSKYDIAYSAEMQLYTSFLSIDTSKLRGVETSGLLEKVITGSKDSQIGQFIEVLNNSDWVKQGTNYIPNSNEKCPFCQQTLSNKLQKKIENYFDEEYENDYQSIEKFVTDYNIYFDNVNNIINKILESNISIIDYTSLESKREIFNKQLKLNNERLQKKLESPSTKVTIDSFENMINEINHIIESYNKIIISNNLIVKNKEHEQKKCKESLWNFIVNSLEMDLKEYNEFREGKQKAKEGITTQITFLRSEIQENTIKIEDIENSLTSVVPTVKEINRILENFDFKGFHLKENKSQVGTYLILRDDGTNVWIVYT